MRPWIAYGLLRVGVFAVAFTVLMLIRPDLWWVWAFVAAILSLCIGYIFFGKLRDAAAREFSQRQSARVAGVNAPVPGSDEEAEDR